MSNKKERIYYTGDIVQEIETGAYGVVTKGELEGNGYYGCFAERYDDISKNREYSCDTLPRQAERMSKVSWFDEDELVIVERGPLYKYMRKEIKWK